MIAPLTSARAACRKLAAMPAGIDAGFVEVNGSRLYFEARGSGPALLFLHGFTLDRRMWRPQVEALCDRFRVVAYDARGFGRSALPGEEPYRHCDDAAALCTALGLGRVVAVGHSIGAHQTLELALERPELVAGWVSIGMAGLAGVPFPQELSTLFAEIRRAASGESLDAARAIWRRGAWFAPAREASALAAELDRMFADYSGWHWTHDNPVRGLDPPAAERLGELRVPALVITGGRDLAYNHEIAARLRAGIPGARGLELAGAGHMTNMEAPGAVTDAIAALAAAAFRDRGA
jgi:pimeloyl-ACP methyl ester carboxylesterase